MRNVIVTGASRGIGLAIATELAQSGYRVLAIARRASAALTAAGSAAHSAGTGAIEFRPCDLSHTDGIPALIEALCAEFGAPYALVNNAGIGTGGLLGSMPLDEIEYLVRLNTLAPMILARQVLPLMQSQRCGRIVNISSIVALTGYSGLSVYGASKASLVGFTRSLAREVGQFDITVNAIAPGFIATEMTQELDEAQRAKIMRRSALKRLPDAIDVARSVAYLLSDAARNITGTVITIDAGNTT